MNGFNLANGETLTAFLKRYSAMFNAEHKIFGNSLVGFADVIVAHTETWTQLNAQPVVPYLEDAHGSISMSTGITPALPPRERHIFPTLCAGQSVLCRATLRRQGPIDCRDGFRKRPDGGWQR